MPYENRKRILYLDDFSIPESEYYTVVDGVEIFGSDDTETARRMYDENKPFDLVCAHLSTFGSTDFFEFVRKRDKKCLIYCMSALKNNRESAKEFLDDFSVPCDGILLKNSFREPVGMTLDRLVRTLKQVEEKQTQNA